MSFLGSRTATVNYNVATGDVTLTNFLGGGGSLAVNAVPEPSSVAMIAVAGFILLSFGAGAHRQRANSRGLQCLQIRA